MNNIDRQYQSLLQDILDNGVKKSDRTGTGTLSVFGRQIRHKMSEGFPLLTTKKMAWKSIVTELLWFLRDDTNIKFLVDNGCHIWDGDAYKSYLKEHSKNPNETAGLNDGTPFTKEEFIILIQSSKAFAHKWGDLGPIYGKQWRNWTYLTREQKEDINGIDELICGADMFDSYRYYRTVDQIANLINDLKTNPDSRRLMVNAWNVGELDEMVLPPCHYGFQVYTRELSFEEKNKLYVERCLASGDGLSGSAGPDGLDYEFYENLFAKYNIPTRAISLMWNQRSVDTFLGLPFNIASYALLLEIIAKEVNMLPEEVIGNLGDVHLYVNHIEQAKEQITRVPYELSKINFSWYIDNWNTPEAKEVRKDSFDAYIRQMRPSDFVIENYQSHPTIKATLSN
jgi:thymidylate synthase